MTTRTARTKGRIDTSARDEKIRLIAQVSQREQLIRCLLKALKSSKALLENAGAYVPESSDWNTSVQKINEVIMTSEKVVGNSPFVN